MAITGCGKVLFGYPQDVLRIFTDVKDVKNAVRVLTKGSTTINEKAR